MSRVLFPCPEGSKCIAAGCGNERIARGLCRLHYNRLWVAGELSRKPSDEERFWSHVEKTGGCWLWTASRSKQGRGYGQFFAGRVRINAHRYSWEFHRGPIPPGLVVMHRCDNPPCVNPAHLALGTHVENQADKVLKDRQARGESAGRTKLCAAEALEIHRRSNSEPLLKLAREFGVNSATVWAIKVGRSWRHLNQRNTNQSQTEGN